ncbi:extracellular solute-binding protein [Saccharibacillus sp. CPCC 101409]|uniref:extracellular solute-binding protein n=1 Tax=Saccharibacillus sp. CPCC 101409 TaxID=3058041 RepID=UPI002670EBBA|nr:extracellular solute-binding protein [Saccharibacillus sp. CPCC 101409]MDO3412556.1 extracellular solute-binding protein [Saccharibacillus sp. CPCC 101409]
MTRKRLSAALSAKTAQKAVYAILAATFALTAAGCSSSPNNSSAEAGGGTSGDKRGSITVSLYDRGTVPASEGTMDNNRWTKWVNENGPVDVKYVTVPRFESLQKFNVLFASRSAPDLIFEFDTAYQGQLYNQKQLLPLDDLIETSSTGYKAILDKYPALRKAGTMEDGKLYLVGRPMQLAPQHYLLIRKDWLDKLGLEVPTTPEEYLKVAEAFTQQDPDGDGKADTEGTGLSFVAGIILNHMYGTGFTLFGEDQIPWVLENGKVVHDWERIRAAVSFQQQLYDAGVADKDFVTDKNGEKQKQMWISGKLGIYGSNGADVGSYEALKQNVPEAEVIAMQLPATQFGSYSPTLSSPVQMTGMVNAAAKDPESVMKMIDFMVGDEYTNTIQNGIEGEHYEKTEDGRAKAIDPEKNKTELEYNRDMSMLTPLIGKNYGIKNKVNPTAAEKDFIKIYEQAEKAYMDPSRPMVGITQRAYLPLLPQNLTTINTNANKTILDLAMQTIVGGGGQAAVDKFITDAQAVWDKAGGAQVDEFYANWYAESKDDAILMEDIYEIGEQMKKEE